MPSFPATHYSDNKIIIPHLRLATKPILKQQRKQPVKPATGKREYENLTPFLFGLFDNIQPIILLYPPESVRARFASSPSLAHEGGALIPPLHVSSVPSGTQGVKNHLHRHWSRRCGMFPIRLEPRQQYYVLHRTSPSTSLRPPSEISSEFLAVNEPCIQLPHHLTIRSYGAVLPATTDHRIEIFPV